MTRTQNEKKYGDDVEEYARMDCFSDFSRWRRALLSCAVRSVVLINLYCYDHLPTLCFPIPSNFVDAVLLVFVLVPRLLGSCLLASCSVV